MLGRILKKMQMQVCEAVLILPAFMALRLSSLLLRLLIARPILLPAQAIFLPQEPEKPHPMRNLKLLACAVSSVPGENKEFLDQLEMFFGKDGERVPEISTKLTLRSGKISVSTETLVL